MYMPYFDVVIAVIITIAVGLWDLVRTCSIFKFDFNTKVHYIN